MPQIVPMKEIMSNIIINRFGPSALQILEAALSVANSPEAKLVVNQMPNEGDLVLGGAEWTGRRRKDYERGLAYIHELVGRNNLKNQVFLGGACGVPWRADAIKRLEEAGCRYYNPEVDDFEARDAQLKADGLEGGLPALEVIHKTASYVLLFVFDPGTRALATLNECAEFLIHGSQQMVVVRSLVEEGLVLGGQALTKEETDDINAAREALFDLLIDASVDVVDTVDEAIGVVIGILKSNEEDFKIRDRD